MISLDLTKSSEVRIAGDRPKCMYMLTIITIGNKVLFIFFDKYNTYYM